MEYNQTHTWREINETPEIFTKILEKNATVLAELVQTIKDSGKTNFVAAARGSSNNALVFFKYMLEFMTDYTVGFSAPSILTLYKGKISYANSIIIGCSQSGRAEDVLEVIKKGNEQNAITIAVTNDENSPIAKNAKYHLNLCAGEEQSFVATKTFNAEMFLLLWLATELAGARENRKLLSHLSIDLEHVIPQIDDLTSTYAEKFKDMRDGFVLARGLTYPIALESSLILQETCRIPVKGYAGSEFYHGPMAMVNENTPIIIYCARFDGDEEVQSIIRADQMKLIKKMLSLNAPVLLVTNDCVLTGKFKNCNDALLYFSLPEKISAFAFAVFAQMLACKISCLKGLNPDNPANMEKTTITK